MPGQRQRMIDHGTVELVYWDPAAEPDDLARRLRQHIGRRPRNTELIRRAGAMSLEAPAILRNTRRSEPEFETVRATLSRRIHDSFRRVVTSVLRLGSF